MSLKYRKMLNMGGEGADIFLHQSAEHGRTRRDLARARYKMGGARRAHLILSGAPGHFRYLY